MNGVARGKLRPAGIGGVLRDEKGNVLFMFSKYVGAKDSSEAGVLAILEAIHSYSCGLCDYLIIESDSSNAISWMKTLERLALESFSTTFKRSKRLLHLFKCAFNMWKIC